MKTKIILYGKLAHKFRKEFEFSNITKITDTAKAISCIYPDFRQQLQEDTFNGINYQIVVNDKVVNNWNDLKTNFKKIEIIPTVIGNGPAGGFVFGMLFSVAVAGIMYLMTPIPEIQPQEISQEVSATSRSYALGSNSNLAAQGQAVPIRYGLLRVGSSMVSSTIENLSMREVKSYKIITSPSINWSDNPPVEEEERVR
jgi:predicted phage tail protein